MADLQMSLTIPYITALPSDIAVTTWAFSNVDITTSAEMEEIADLVTDELGSLIGPLLSDRLNGAAARVKFYNLASPHPRAPIFNEGRVIAGIPVSGGNLPGEVALCMSFQGVQVSGEPQARKRGRIYLGPFINNVDVINANGDPGTALTNGAVALGQAILDASNAATWFWGVYSRVDNEVYRVDNGWVDDAFDTQRRRGEPPTARTTFTT